MEGYERQSSVLWIWRIQSWPKIRIAPLFPLTDHTTGSGFTEPHYHLALLMVVLSLQIISHCWKEKKCNWYLLTTWQILNVNTRTPPEWNSTLLVYKHFHRNINKIISWKSVHLWYYWISVFAVLLSCWFYSKLKLAKLRGEEKFCQKVLKVASCFPYIYIAKWFKK